MVLVRLPMLQTLACATAFRSDATSRFSRRPESRHPQLQLHPRCELEMLEWSFKRECPEERIRRSCTGGQSNARVSPSSQIRNCWTSSELPFQSGSRLSWAIQTDVHDQTKKPVLASRTPACAKPIAKDPLDSASNAQCHPEDISTARKAND